VDYRKFDYYFRKRTAKKQEKHSHSRFYSTSRNALGHPDIAFTPSISKISGADVMVHEQVQNTMRCENNAATTRNDWINLFDMMKEVFFYKIAVIGR
jgi:hypothetical protein